MGDQRLNRREFIQRTSAAIAGAAAVSALPAAVSGQSLKRTAADQVPLGKTGIMLSRLGIGTGPNNGAPLVALGKEGFIKLIRHAYDQGITYIDTAQQYRTFEWIGDAIQDLPREKVFIQSKIAGRPQDVMKVIDQQRGVYKTDYIDSMLIHCRVEPDWTDAWKYMMDAFDEAKQKKWILAKGVSCHTFPALQAATASDWTEVHLVRVNPQGKYLDGERPEWSPRPTHPVEPILEQIRLMHEKGRGVIGMKIMGNGLFANDPAEREKSVRFAMSNPNIDAVTIGMCSTKEIDENIALLNRALSG